MKVYAAAHWVCLFCIKYALNMFQYARYAERAPTRRLPPSSLFLACWPGGSAPGKEVTALQFLSSPFGSCSGHWVRWRLAWKDICCRWLSLDLLGRAGCLKNALLRRCCRPCLSCLTFAEKRMHGPVGPVPIAKTVGQVYATYLTQFQSLTVSARLLILLLRQIPWHGKEPHSWDLAATRKGRGMWSSKWNGLGGCSSL